MIPQLSSHYITDCSTSQATSTASFLWLIRGVLFPWFTEHHSRSLRHQTIGDIDVSDFKGFSRSNVSANKFQPRVFWIEKVLSHSSKQVVFTIFCTTVLSSINGSCVGFHTRTVLSTDDFGMLVSWCSAPALVVTRWMIPGRENAAGNWCYSCYQQLVLVVTFPCW